jgi:DNA-binding NarL/FixJ family response regulator
VPFEAGRGLAGIIPGARFVPLESRNHILTEGEPAWTRFLAELDGFLEVGGPRPAGSSFENLTPREREVLEQVAQGLSNTQIAATLGVTPKTVRNHLTRVFSKLGVTTRAEAIVLARKAGFGEEAG